MKRFGVLEPLRKQFNAEQGAKNVAPLVELPPLPAPAVEPVPQPFQSKKFDAATEARRQRAVARKEKATKA